MRLSVADDDGRANAFDSLRLLAALAVVVSHAAALTGHGNAELAGEAASHIGVGAFFAISGFLVTRSWCREPVLPRFLAKRALRLMPALVVTTLATAYVLGPLATSLSLGEYLSRGETHRFVLGSWIMWPDRFLPGVFPDNPIPGVANGSLWTIPVEARCYIAIAFVGAAGLLMRFGWRLMAVAALALALAGLGPLPWRVVGSLPFAWEYTATFASASAMYLVRSRIALDGRWFAAALAVWLASLVSTRLHMLVTPLALPYVVLGLAYRWGLPLRRLARPGDASYGLYLIAFPVQQIVAAHSTSALVNFAVAAPVAYGLGLALWHYVELPCLRLKRRFATPTAPLPAAAPSAT